MELRLVFTIVSIYYTAGYVIAYYEPLRCTRTFESENSTFIAIEFFGENDAVFHLLF